MNWVDLLLLAVLGWFLFTGLTSGLIREVLNLAGFGVGLFLAGRLYGQVGELLKGVVEPGLAPLAGFVGILIATVVATHVVGSLLQQVVSLLMLGWLDHLGGALFGLVKGLALVMVLLFVVQRLPFPPLKEALEVSLLGPRLAALLPVLLALLPADLAAIASGPSLPVPSLPLPTLPSSPFPLPPSP